MWQPCIPAAVPAQHWLYDDSDDKDAKDRTRQLIRRARGIRSTVIRPSYRPNVPIAIWQRSHWSGRQAIRDCRRSSGRRRHWRYQVTWRISAIYAIIGHRSTQLTTLPCTVITNMLVDRQDNNQAGRPPRPRCSMLLQVIDPIDLPFIHEKI